MNSFFISLVFAAFISVILAFVAYSLGKVVFSCPGGSFAFRGKMRLFCYIMALLFTVFVFFRQIFIPEKKTYKSPDGFYTAELAFYPYLPERFEDYRFKAFLRASESGEILGEAGSFIRGIFVDGPGDTVCWENCVLVKWIDEEDVVDKLWIIFPDMNTAYLLPSGERVFPLTDPRADRVLRRKK